MLPSRHPRRPILLTVVIGLAVVSSAGCAVPEEPAASWEASPSRALAASAGATASTPASPSGGASAGLPSPSPAPPSASPGTELALDELLALLVIAPEQRSGYDRSLFRHWIDADGDGCNTRREVLIAEAVSPPEVGGGCSLTGGSWVSLYDGLLFTDPVGMDIDHVVALGEAWDSGAHAWTPERREAFANDLDVSWALIAVSASSNRSKSDKDPADWVPPDPDNLCPFVSAWIAVKVRWALSVDEVERAALVSLVGSCGSARMPVLPAP